jgi:hypothetical protein
MSFDSSIQHKTHPTPPSNPIQISMELTNESISKNLFKMREQVKIDIQKGRRKSFIAFL